MKRERKREKDTTNSRDLGTRPRWPWSPRQVLLLRELQMLVRPPPLHQSRPGSLQGNGCPGALALSQAALGIHT